MMAASGLDAFYPIVPDAAWVRRVVPLGVRTLQLRLKDADDARIRDEVAQSLDACRATGCQLIVNDYWQVALALGADYVHLGQEDLATADVPALKAAGIRLGISTHDLAELETALAVDPDYVALGPIWETKLKAMKWAPQGLDRIRAWKERIGTRPLVAIGGITPDRAPQVLAAGAQSVAVITDFITNPDPDAQITAWVSWARTIR